MEYMWQKYFMEGFRYVSRIRKKDLCTSVVFLFKFSSANDKHVHNKNTQHDSEVSKSVNHKNFISL